MLEGFPLLHLECYTADGGGIGWPDWVARYGYRETAPGVGIRYRRVTQALEAVYADAGFIMCGLALIRPKIEEGLLEIPFPVEKGEWSRNAYQASFRLGARRREQTERFRTWLLEQAKETRRELADLVDQRCNHGNV